MSIPGGHQQNLRNEKVSARIICKRDGFFSPFRSEVVPFNPRSPQQQSSTG